MTGLPARRAALEASSASGGGEPLDAALDRVLGPLPEADRRLAYEIAAGVLRSRTTLDERLAPLVPRGWDGVAAPLRDVLRIGAYQLTALDRVPAHAAVDTSVALAREAGGARAGGFVNAVLRRVARAADRDGRDGPEGRRRGGGAGAEAIRTRVAGGAGGSSDSARRGPRRSWCATTRDPSWSSSRPARRCTSCGSAG